MVIFMCADMEVLLIYIEGGADKQVAGLHV
jgi:hypothetical protein